MSRARGLNDKIPNGGLDGRCDFCGAPRRRMGWMGQSEYWLMCTASFLTADGEAPPYGLCDLPSLEQARRRLAAEQVTA